MQLDLCAKQVATEVWAQPTCGVLCLVATTVWWELWGFVETAADSFPPVCVCLCERVALAVLLVCVWSRSCNNLWVCDVYTFLDIFKSIPLWSLCPGLWWGMLWGVGEHSKVYFQLWTIWKGRTRQKRNCWVTRLGKFVVVAVRKCCKSGFCVTYIAHCRQTMANIKDICLICQNPIYCSKSVFLDY